MGRAAGLALVMIFVGAIAAKAGSLTEDANVCWKDKTDEGMAACNRVLGSSKSTEDDLYRAHVNRGQTHYGKSDYEQAIADFTKALKIDNKRPLPFGNRANCKYMLKRYGEAIEDYTKAIAVDSDYAAAYTGRGLAYEKKGDIAEAKASFKKALAAPQKFEDGAWAHDTARKRLEALEAASAPKAGTN